MNKLSEFVEGTFNVGSTRRVVYVLLLLLLLGYEGTSLTSELLPRKTVSLAVSSSITIDFFPLASELDNHFMEHDAFSPSECVEVNENSKNRVR